MAQSAFYPVVMRAVSLREKQVMFELTTPFHLVLKLKCTQL
jgi:hypothetical protein